MMRFKDEEQKAWKIIPRDRLHAVVVYRVGGGAPISEDDPCKVWVFFENYNGPYHDVLNLTYHEALAIIPAHMESAGPACGPMIYVSANAPPIGVSDDGKYVAIHDTEIEPSMYGGEEDE